MKINFTKHSILLLASLFMCCMFTKSVKAEENITHCYPSDAQIQEYKEDGTWEKRQEYAKKLNHGTPSKEIIYRAIQREYGLTTYVAGEDVPDVWKGMQVTGDAKMLLVRVEFADVKFEDSKIYSEEDFYEMIMGNGDKGENFPYESLNAYYKRSSYNKLNIISDKVYNCTLSKNRYEYEWEDFGEQDLIKEVMEMLDDTVDFAEYDANNDGQLDGICINFAGENTGWGTTWWSHKYDFIDSSIAFDGVTPSGYIFLETYTGDDSYGIQTLIHETGHLLGLPDYYSQTSNGIGTTDMMNNNSGDHNGFSKWLLGWIEEDNILRINRDFGDTEVVLSPISAETPGNEKLIAVIAPEDTSIYSEYFVVQYDECIGNQSIVDLESPAYRVYHVNARLNYDGTDFMYNNIYAYDKLLIQSVSITDGEYGLKRYFYREGDALTPDTNESSEFYGGEIFGFTGIEIKDFKTGDSPAFKVSFREKEVIDGKLEFEIMEDVPSNMVTLTLLSNKPLVDACSYQNAYLEDNEGNQYPLNIYFEDGSQQIKVSYLNIENSLKPETEYTLVIPEGMFQIDRDVYSEECRFTVKTGVFPKIVADYTYESNYITPLFILDETKSGFIERIDNTDEECMAKLHVFEETEEVKVTNINIPMPEIYTEIMDVSGLCLYDGSIVLQIRLGNKVDYSTIYSFYKLDQSGNLLAGPFCTIEKLSIIPVGNILKGTLADGGAVGSPNIEDEYKLEIYTIDFENEITFRLINMHKYISNVYALDEESYVVIQNLGGLYSASIFNLKDEQIGTIDLSAYINDSIFTVVKVDGKLVITYTSYLESEEYALMVSEFNVDGTHLGTYEISRYKNWKYVDGWKMEKTNWGYSLYNYTPEQPYIIYLLNDEFEIIYYMELPDTLSDATYIGSRCIAKWYDITTWGYRVGITEPIIVETPKPEQEPKPEIKPEQTPEIKPEPTPESKPSLTPEQPQKPGNPSGDIADNNTSVNTGDKSHQMKIYLLIMIVSGSIIVGCRRCFWLLGYKR